MAFRRYHLHIRGDDRKRVLKEIYQNNPQISEIRGLLTSRIIDPILDSYPDITVKDLMDLNPKDFLLLRGFGPKASQLLDGFLKELEEAGLGKKPQQEVNDEMDTAPTIDTCVCDPDIEGFEEEQPKNAPTKRCAWSGYVKKNGYRVPGCSKRLLADSTNRYCSRMCSLCMFCKYMAEEMAWIIEHQYGIKDWELPITIEEFATLILHKEGVGRGGPVFLDEICIKHKIDLKKATMVINHPLIRVKFPKVFTYMDHVLDSYNAIDNKMAEYMAKDKKRGVTHVQFSNIFGIPLYKINQRLGHECLGVNNEEASEHQRSSTRTHKP